MSEIDEIRDDYEHGRLDSIKQDLERFILAHRARIQAYQKDQEEKGLPMADDIAIRFYIIQQRTINPAAEIRDQLLEIEREKWIRGVQTGCAPDAQEVALEWARNHSAGWRAHRVTTIVYCFSREKDRYVQVYRDACGPAARPA